MTTIAPALGAFVSDIERLVAAEPDDLRVVGEVRRRLDALLGAPDFLAPEFREPWPNRYRAHLVTVAPSRRFSVVSLVWLPGQVTPIHDHICWCVVGVLQGREEEQRYALRAGTAGERWLVPGERETLPVGGTCALVPPEENIHQVRNAGDGLAISIHIYGEDIGVYHSSINQCFDDLPIRAGDDRGKSVAWRLAARQA